jgi:hypothetical protein
MQHIPFDEFLKRVELSRDDFGFPDIRNIREVVALRELRRVLSVNSMPISYLEKLLSRITIKGNPDIRVYANRPLRLLRVDPTHVKVGQTFIERQNYISILEDFPRLFDQFAISRGIAKLTALIVIGEDKEGHIVLAHYLPPIIESHGGKLILMDGMHRNFIVKNIGTTIESIVIEDVEIPFPCSTHDWDSIKILDEKPKDVKDRFFDLKPELFRDVKSLGIDG